MENHKNLSKDLVRKSSKRIKDIYSEINKGLRQGSMKIDMVRVKLSEAGLLINELEKSTGDNVNHYSYSED